MKYSNGFTFIEVLVVSLIVAILAAVAIPVYNGYVLKQRKSVANDMAATAAISANVFYRRHDRNPSVAELNIFIPDSARYNMRISGNSIIVSDSLDPSDIVRDTASFR